MLSRKCKRDDRVAGAERAAAAGADEDNSTRRHDRTAEVYGAREAAHRAQRDVPEHAACDETHRHQRTERRRRARKTSGTQDDAPAQEVRGAAHVGVLEVRHAACRIDGFGAVVVEAVCDEKLHHGGDAIYRHDGETMPFIYSDSTPMGPADVAGL